MVPVDSPWATSYLTSIYTDIVSVTILKYLTSNFDDLELGQFKVIQRQRSSFQSIAHGRLPIRLLLTLTSHMSPFLRYLTSNFDDLEHRQFKVIQGQRSWW